MVTRMVTYSQFTLAAHTVKLFEVEIIKLLANYPSLSFNVELGRCL